MPSLVSSTASPKHASPRPALLILPPQRCPPSPRPQNFVVADSSFCPSSPDPRAPPCLPQPEGQHDPASLNLLITRLVLRRPENHLLQQRRLPLPLQPPIRLLAHSSYLLLLPSAPFLARMSTSRPEHPPATGSSTVLSASASTLCAAPTAPAWAAVGDIVFDFAGTGGLAGAHNMWELLAWGYDENDDGWRSTRWV